MIQALVHDMMQKEAKVYVDNNIVKSKSWEGHVPALRKFFKKTTKIWHALKPIELYSTSKNI